MRKFPFVASPSFTFHCVYCPSYIIQGESPCHFAAGTAIPPYRKIYQSSSCPVHGRVTVSRDGNHPPSEYKVPHIPSPGLHQVSSGDYPLAQVATMAVAFALGGTGIQIHRTKRILPVNLFGVWPLPCPAFGAPEWTVEVQISSINHQQTQPKICRSRQAICQCNHLPRPELSQLHRSR